MCVKQTNTNKEFKIKISVTTIPWITMLDYKASEIIGLIKSSIIQQLSSKNCKLWIESNIKLLIRQLLRLFILRYNTNTLVQNIPIRKIRLLF